MPVIRELLTSWGFDIDDGDLKRLDEELGAVVKKADSFGQRLDNLGRGAVSAGAKFTGFVTAPITLLGKSMLGAAGDFEAGMNRVEALTIAAGNSTQEQFDRLTGQARELGRTTQFTAAQTAGAMGFLAQAGFNAEQIFKSIPSTLDLAGAAQLDFATTADIISNIMTGMKVPFDEIGTTVDTVTKAFITSNTNLSQLGEAMKQAGPVAQGFNLPLNETVAILGLMGNAGIQASLAGTSLKNALTRLAAPSKEVEKLMAKLGVANKNADGSFRPLIEVMADLETKGADAAHIMEIFGLRAGPAFQALLAEGTTSIRQFADQLKDVGGTAAKVQKIQLKGLVGETVKMKSAWEGLQLAVADSGALTMITELITSITEFIAKMAETNKTTFKTILTITALAAAIGPLLLLFGATARAISWIIKLRTELLILMAAQNLTGKSALLMQARLIALPLAIIAAFGLVIGIIEDVFSTLQGKRTVISTLAEKWGIDLQKLIADFKAAFEIIGIHVSNTFNTIKNVAVTVFNFIRDTVMFVVTEIVDFVTRLGNGLSKFWGLIKKPFEFLGIWLANVGKDLLEFPGKLIDGFVSLGKTIYDSFAIFNDFKNTLSNAIDYPFRKLGELSDAFFNLFSDDEEKKVTVTANRTEEVTTNRRPGLYTGQTTQTTNLETTARLAGDKPIVRGMVKLQDQLGKASKSIGEGIRKAGSIAVETGQQVIAPAMAATTDFLPMNNNLVDVAAAPAAMFPTAPPSNIVNNHTSNQNTQATKHIEVKANIEMTVPPGTPREQVQAVESAAEKAAKRVFDREVRKMASEGPGID